MLRLLGLLLVVRLAITVIGAVVKGFWLAVVGALIFAGTAVLGWVQRAQRSLPRGR